MINYSVEKENLSVRVKELALAQVKPLLILLPIALLLAVYFLIIGYLVDAEALSFAYPLIFLVVFICWMYFMTLYSYRKQVYKSFDEASFDGKVNYSIEKTNEFFEVTCLNNAKKFVFSNSDISKISFQKHIIVVKMNSRKVIDFPNTAEISKLFR